MLKPRLFCFWTDDNTMSADRQNALSSLSNTGLEVIFVNQENLSNWILKNVPLHTSYEYLSSVHKADYLRCYFMHHYGGAYSDVKVIEDSWLPSFEELEKSDYLINGYREINCIETARGRGLLNDIWLALNFYKVIGNGAYICKPNTSFTNEWFNTVQKILDSKSKVLEKYPSNCPRDFYLKRYNDGSISNYPIRWTEICGEVFHPLCLKYSKKILKNLPTPDFSLPYL